MGLLVDFLEPIVREHVYRPICGDVLLIGRQTMYLSPLEALQLIRRCGSTVADISPDEIEIDHTTQNRLSSWQGKDLISDSAFFRILGIQSLKALDHTAYEGAEIIHDLKNPLPEALRGCADFIVDGSTLDNTFDPALTLKNLADLLRPGGRLITVNMASNSREPYTVPGPLWYLDYFVMNGFLDCKVYIQLFFDGMDCPERENTFSVDLDCFQNTDHGIRSFTSPYEMVVVVFAERGPNSTTDIRPTQQHYRSPDEWAVYRRNLAGMRQSSRPHICRSRDKLRYFKVPKGYQFIDSERNAREPAGEMPQLRAVASRLRSIWRRFRR